MPDTDRPTTSTGCVHRADHHHGTLAGYATDLCRCDDCRGASRRYQRKLEDKKRDPNPLPNDDPTTPLLAALLLDADWQDRAACLGMDVDLFFPDRGASTKKAKATCAECPVQQECLDYAVEAGEKFGIWGGLSERPRRQVKKQRVA